MIQQLNRKNTVLTLLVTAGIVVGATTVNTQAAIPSTSDQKIHACYRNGANMTNPAGSVRVIDTQNSESCSEDETELSWQQRNAPGTFVDDLTGADMSGMDLRYRDFSSRNLTGIKLNDANLLHASFKGSNLTDASIVISPNITSDKTGLMDFRDTTLAGATLYTVDADFRGANFDDAIVSGYLLGNFSGVDFTNAVFQPRPTGETMGFCYANLSNTNFSGKVFGQGNQQNVICNSDASGADFSNTDFIGTQFDGVTATNTDFTNASFTGAAFTTTDLSTATLTGATWSNTTCPDGTNSNDHSNTCAGHLQP